MSELIRLWDAPKTPDRDNAINQLLLPATEKLLNDLKKYADDVRALKKQAALWSLEKLLAFSDYPKRKENILAICEHLRNDHAFSDLSQSELSHYPKRLADIR